MKIYWQIVIAILSVTRVHAQNEIEIKFPEEENWNIITEGETLTFKFEASGGMSGNYSFSAISEDVLGIQLTKEGAFEWTPGYSLIAADEKSRKFPLIIEVTNEGGQISSRQVDLVVKQKNRLPDFTGLDPFYIKKDSINKYHIRFNQSEFRLEMDSSQIPSGFQYTEAGEIQWKPTQEQFDQLKQKPVLIDFFVHDLQYDDVIPGKLEVWVNESAQATAKQHDDNKQEKVRLLLPKELDWNVVSEGDTMSFKLTARGGTDQKYKFTLSQGAEAGISFDTLGNLFWSPDYDFVDRLEETKTVPVIFEVSNASNESDRRQVNLVVYHTNRPPEVEELKPFYVQYGVQNTYQLNSGNNVKDPDNDPIVFKPVLSEMPQGMTLNGKGEISWKPSVSQYYKIQNDSMYISFLVEDQPYKALATGRLPVKVTQQDLPPEISMVPNQDKFRIKEDETLNLKFYLSDPNGDQDIQAFDFVADSRRIPKSALVKNDLTQWEFVWMPGYDFFVEPGDTGTYTITFYVIDFANQRKEKQVQVMVKDAENLIEKDRLLYSQYRSGLVRVWNLMEQLKEREKELKKEYRRAKRGKKHRNITTASLGAITGISPVVLNDEPDAQKYVSGIGGTTSMTIGSLEAGNVIGRDPSRVFERLSYINTKLNELDTQGNVFAGKYALSNNRRSKEFTEDLKKLIMSLSLKDVTTLELEASWENPKKPTDKNIQNTFKDFHPDESKSIMINE